MKDGEVVLKNSRIKDFYVSNDNFGSLFYSNTDTTVRFTLQSNTIQCKSVGFTQTYAVQRLKDKLSTYAGAIYFEGSKATGTKGGLFSKDNTYKTCYDLLDGGVFYVVEATLDEQRSSFIDIYALYGSVMKCRDCTFNFTDANLDGNQAQSGGVFMIEN